MFRIKKKPTNKKFANIHLKGEEILKEWQQIKARIEKEKGMNLTNPQILKLLIEKYENN